MTDSNNSSAPATGLPANTAAPPAAPPSPPDPEDAFTSRPASEEYYFEAERGRFWLRNDSGEWVNLSEGAFKRHLKKQGKRDKANVQAGESISQMDEVIRDVEQNHRVDFAGELAGYKAGVRIITGQRVLVTRTQEVIEPRKGEWPVLRAFFEQLFRGEEPAIEEGGKPQVIDQTDRWYAWHRHVMECYMSGEISPGLALCVAGEADCGKSRLAMILKWCLGGRVSKPYDFMIGRDNFNRDMYGAVLQLVDDENADTSINARLKFGAQVKKIVANDDNKLRGMHRDGINLSVLWRLVVLVNLEANRLMVMPPIDGDIRDKLLMLKGYRRPPPAGGVTIETPAEQACWPMPMPTRTEDERRAFRERLLAELPAYLWWLLKEYKVPSLVSGGRFCVRHWQHPQILERLQQFSPHVRLWQLIESSEVVFYEYVSPSAVDEPATRKERTEWTGSARELYDLLKSEKSKLTADEKRAIPEPAWLGQRLESCREHFGESVATQKRTGRGRVWILHHRPGLVD